MIKVKNREHIPHSKDNNTKTLRRKGKQLRFYTKMTLYMRCKNPIRRKYGQDNLVNEKDNIYHSPLNHRRIFESSPPV